jgi:hypothetical protein
LTFRSAGAILRPWPTALTSISTRTRRPAQGGGRRRAGVSLETYALQALDQAWMANGQPPSRRSTTMTETGVSYAAEDAIAEFRANVEAGLAKRK